MRILLALILIFSCVANAAPETLPAATAAVVAAPVETTNSGEETKAVVPAKAAVDTRTEAEIPLNLEANRKANTEEGGFFRILFTLSILGLVGAGAFFFLRKYSVPKAMKHQTQIKVLQQHYLGPKKSLAIVRVAGESILIGVTDHNISMIKALSLLDDEVPEEAPQSFNNVLGQRPVEDFEDESAPVKRDSRSLDSDEEFAISGIKDIVSKRLKGMRSLQ